MNCVRAYAPCTHLALAAVTASLAFAEASPATESPAGERGEGLRRRRLFARPMLDDVDPGRCGLSCSISISACAILSSADGGSGGSGDGDRDRGRDDLGLDDGRRADVPVFPLDDSRGTELARASLVELRDGVGVVVVSRLTQSGICASVETTDRSSPAKL